MVRNLTVMLAGLVAVGMAATAFADNDLLRLDGKGDAKIEQARGFYGGYRGGIGYRGGYGYRGGIGYRGGYGYRGFYGYRGAYYGGYRGYYRPGYSVGYYSAPYYSGYYSPYYYSPSYYYSPPVYYYSPPLVLSSAAQAPCDVCDPGVSAPSGYIAPQPQSVRAPVVRQPNAPTAVSQPGNRPTYKYDGGPRSVVPPPPSPAPMTNPAAPAPMDGRLVSNSSAPRYLAYGEKAETPARATRIAAQPTDNDSDDLVPISYRARSTSSFEGGTMIYTQTGVR